MGRKSRSTQGAGPAVDAWGGPVIDPSRNTNALVEAGLKRQDDLRNMQAMNLQRQGGIVVVGITIIGFLSSWYGNMVRKAESARLDSIRSVDQSAVGAARVESGAQAEALRTQVVASAEAMRNSTAATATAQAANLDARILPITNNMDTLNRSMYALQGERSAKTEGKDSNQWLVTSIIAAGACAVTFILARQQQQQAAAINAGHSNQWITTTTVSVAAFLAATGLGIAGIVVTFLLTHHP